MDIPATTNTKEYLLDCLGHALAARKRAATAVVMAEAEIFYLTTELQKHEMAPIPVPPHHTAFREACFGPLLEGVVKPGAQMSP